MLFELLTALISALQGISSAVVAFLTALLEFLT